MTTEDVKRYEATKARRMMKESRLSYSALKAFAKSPNHFIHYKTKERTDSPAMALGRAVHGFILEREKFDDQFLIMPKLDKRTKKGKEMYTELMATAQGKQLVDEGDMIIVKKIAEAVSQTESAMQLLIGTEREQHVESEIHGIPFHGFGDAVKMGAYCIDLKTCRDASPDAFMRDAHNMDYHLQAAVYRSLFQVERFYWIAVEKEAPYNVTVFAQSDDAAKKSDHYLNTLIQNWKAWDGKAKSYSNEILNLDLPRWA